MTPEQFAIVNAIREAFNQLRFRFVAAEGFSVRVPWQEDPLEGEGRLDPSHQDRSMQGGSFATVWLRRRM